MTDHRIGSCCARPLFVADDQPGGSDILDTIARWLEREIARLILRIRNLAA